MAQGASRDERIPEVRLERCWTLAEGAPQSYAKCKTPSLYFTSMPDVKRDRSVLIYHCDDCQDGFGIDVELPISGGRRNRPRSRKLTAVAWVGVNFVSVRPALRNLNR